MNVLEFFQFSPLYYWKSRANPFVILFFYFFNSSIYMRGFFYIFKIAIYTRGMPTPLINCHLRIDPVKIDQKVTFAKGLKHRAQNFHFF